MTGNIITITIKILVQFSGCLITYWFSSTSAFYKASNTNTNTAKEQGKYANTKRWQVKVKQSRNRPGVAQRVPGS